MFLKVIVKKEANQRAENISQFWLGANLQYKGLQQVLKDIKDSINPPSLEEKQQEIQNNWSRLASLSQN